MNDVEQAYPLDIFSVDSVYYSFHIKNADKLAFEKRYTAKSAHVFVKSVTLCNRQPGQPTRLSRQPTRTFSNNNNLVSTRYKKSKRNTNKRNKTNTTQNRKNKKLKQTSKATTIAAVASIRPIGDKLFVNIEKSVASDFCESVVSGIGTKTLQKRYLGIIKKNPAVI